MCFGTNKALEAVRKAHNYRYVNIISNFVLLTHLSRWNEASKDIFIHMKR